MFFLDIVGYSGIESIFKLIGLILLCILIIAASYFVTRFIGKRQSGLGADSNFKPIDIYRINQNKYIQLLQVGTKYIVIAVCKDTISVLCELDESELVHKPKDGTKASFKEILAKVKNRDAADTAGTDNGELASDEAQVQENVDSDDVQASGDEASDTVTDTADTAENTAAEGNPEGFTVSDENI